MRKMKNTKKIVMVLTALALCLSMCLLTACGLLEPPQSKDKQTKNKQTNGEQTNEKKSETQTITVYKDNTPISYTVTFGEVAKIDVLTKSEYYFAGAYDSREGGTQYFDASGQSTSVWEKGNPDTFYVRFASIYDLKMEFEETETIHYSGTTDLKRGYTFSPAFQAAIKGNMNRKLEMVYSFRAKGDSFYMRFLDLNTDAAEELTKEKKYNPSSDNYSDFAGSAEISAGKLVRGKVHLRLSAGSYSRPTLLNHAFYIKDLKITFRFVPPAESVTEGGTNANP